MSEESKLRVQAWIAFAVLSILLISWYEGGIVASFFVNYPWTALAFYTIFGCLYFFVFIYALVDIASGIIIGYLLVFLFMQLT